jgi:hypothetical protein
MKLNTDLCGDRNDYNRSVRLKALDAVLEPQTINAENNIIEYLQCYRRDLPPAVWIEN